MRQKLLATNDLGFIRVKNIPNSEDREAKIKEIRNVICELEKELAANVLDPEDKDFWNKVLLLQPNNKEFWNKIDIGLCYEIRQYLEMKNY